MKNNRLLATTLLALCATPLTQAATLQLDIQKAWTHTHSGAASDLKNAEIPAYDSTTNTLWVARVKGVDVLNASTGALIQHIDTTSFGSINSVAIHNGVAAFAIENNVRTNQGVVVFYNTASRAQSGSPVTVGALPDMLTFTPDGSRLLVANEGTPTTYGARIGTTTPRVYGPAANDPVGSVSVIDVASRSVIATPTFNSAPTTGANIRTNTGMDFEPEYITVSGNKAYVTLQEANAIGIIDLNTLQTEKVVGLGVKDFSLPGNTLDPNNNGSVSFINANVKGLYMPDSIASYQRAGQTFLVMANEGDFREDDGDRSAASSSGIGATGILAPLRVSNTDSSPGNLFIAGARSFSIRDASGNLVYDSGDILDKEAFARGIYDDNRSRDKGTEPEGVSLFSILGRTIAAIGLERTTKGAVALFDITDPTSVSFLDMIVSDGDISPEGLVSFGFGGKQFLAFANEVSNTTSVYQISAVPEPETLVMLGMGALILAVKRRQRPV